MADLAHAELSRIFDERIAGALARGATSARESPEVLIVGGQPGAGKSTTIDRLVDDFADRGGLAVVSIDDFRSYHPDYDRLVVEDDTKMAAATRPAAEVWQQMAADWLRVNRRNIAYEAGFRDPDGVLALADRYAEAGYRVSIVAMAVPSGVSRVGIIQRYAQQRTTFGAGRWTTTTSHDSDYDGSIETLRRAAGSPAVSEIILADRNSVIYRQPPGAELSPVDVLAEARNQQRDTTVTEAQLDHALAALHEVGGLSPEIRETAEIARSELGSIHLSGSGTRQPSAPKPGLGIGGAPDPQKLRRSPPQQAAADPKPPPKADPRPKPTGRGPVAS
jgi:hypothetical protein